MIVHLQDDSQHDLDAFLEDASLELELLAIQLDKFTTFSEEISKRPIIWHHLGQNLPDHSTKLLRSRNMIFYFPSHLPSAR